MQRQRTECTRGDKREANTNNDKNESAFEKRHLDCTDIITVVSTNNVSSAALAARKIASTFGCASAQVHKLFFIFIFLPLVVSSSVLRRIFCCCFRFDIVADVASFTSKRKILIYTRMNYCYISSFLLCTNIFRSSRRWCLPQNWRIQVT